MKLLPFGCVVAFGAVVASCNTNSVSPSRVDSVIIGGPDAVLTGVTVSYTLTVSLSNGVTQNLTPRFTSSDPAVATIDDGGNLQPRRHGSTTLTTSYSGLQASKTVQVVTNYSGDWEGGYVVKACQGPWFFGEAGCHAGRVGEVMPIRLTLEQTGNGLNEVRGRLVLDRVLIGAVDVATQTVTGVVNAEGHLTLNGNGAAPAWDDTYFFRIEAWQTTLSGSAMTGRWTQRVDVGGYGSPKAIYASGHQENELVTVTRAAKGPYDY